MARNTALVALCVLLGVAAASAAGPTVLTKDNFDAMIVNGGKNSIVKFYAPWCGHCKALAPAWNELGDAYAGSSSVIIGDVDCTVEESVCNDFEVRGYPTLKYFTAETGPKGEDYNSGRDLDSLKAFVDETLEIKCQVADPVKCTEKEKTYMEKMQKEGKDKVEAAHARLDKMRGGSMKPELKQWVVQRLNILAQIKEA